MARTFYVDSRTGSDANAGTSASAPLASISKVNSLALQPGDVVLFAAGSSYNGTLDVRSGVSGAPITYGAYGTGANPIISSGGDAINVGSDHDVTIRDLQLNNVKGTGIQASGAANIVVDHVTFDTVGSGTNGAAVQFWFSNNITVSNSSVARATGDALWFWEVNGLHVLNNTVLVPQGPSADNMHTYRISNYEIRGNVFSFDGATNSGKGNMIVQESSNGVIADNTFIMTNAHYAIGGTIQNGVVENNHFIGRKEGDWSVALNVTETLGTASNATNMTIRNNFFDGVGTGIYTWDGNNAGTAYRNNFNITGNIFKDLRDPALVAEWPVQLNGSYANNTLINSADPNIGSTAGAWSVTNNIHTTVMPNWIGGADSYAPAPVVPVITGTAGNDQIVGTANADTIWGDPLQDGPTGGNDVLRGGKGDDYLSGGAGSDTYVAERGGGVDTIRWFETGKDKIDVSLFGWKTLAEMQSAGVSMTSGSDANGTPMVTVNFGSGDAFKVIGAASLAATDFTFAVSTAPAPTNPVPAPAPAPTPTGITGTTGADTLKGTAAAETVDGKAGNDTMSGAGGHDTFLVRAGDGQDTVTDFTGFNARPWINAAESDTIRFSGTGMTAANMRMLQSGEDMIITFDGVANTQVTLKGVWTDALDNNVSSAYGFIFDGQSAVTDSFDTLLWGTQMTQVAKANSVMFLTDQDNVISGLENSADVINGQGGNDTLAGLSGDDILRGDAGDDSLDGGAGNDRLDGGIGNDRLTGGTGNDILIGGAGTDTAVFTGVSTDYAFTMGTTVTIKDLKPTANGDDGTDTLSGVEKAQFSDRTVFLDGTNNAPVAMNDAAATNEDTIVTGKLFANDIDFDGDALRTAASTLTSANGATVTIAADGSYSYDPRAASALQALNTGVSLEDSFTYSVNDGRGGASTATMKVTVAGITDAAPTVPPSTPPAGATISGTAGNDRLSGKENVNDVIEGKDGNDTLNGLSGDDTLRGDGGNDVLYGGTGNDKLEGGAGSDQLFGEAGNDRLNGGTGNDYLSGGAGNDVFVFTRGSGTDMVMDFTAGQDKLDLSAFGLGGMAQLATAAKVVSLTATAMYVDFGAGDRLNIYGIGKLAADNIIF